MNNSKAIDRKLLRREIKSIQSLRIQRT